MLAIEKYSQHIGVHNEFHAEEIVYSICILLAFSMLLSACGKSNNKEESTKEDNKKKWLL